MSKDEKKKIEEIEAKIEENRELLLAIKKMQENLVGEFYYEADYPPKEEFEKFG